MWRSIDSNQAGIPGRTARIEHHGATTFLDDFRGSRLVWQRDVGPAPALHEEVDDCVAEGRGRGIDDLVVDDVVELAREQAVDEWRPAVADGMAEEDIAARARVGRHCLASASHDAARPA